MSSRKVRAADPEAVQEKLRQVPENPGVYKYINVKGTILYIGKAKNLKKRVSSYWVGGRQHTRRIRQMLSQVTDIQFIITNTEGEALLLESNLIKEHQPRYNIRLKDGKTYPLICIKNERFPRIFATRKKIPDGSEYHGPYPNAATLHAILDLVRHSFRIRTCNLNLQPDSIAAGKFRICLEYQIGKCAGPCEALVSEAEYMDTVDTIRKILSGSYDQLQQQLRARMMRYADLYQYEKAEEVRLQIERIEAHHQKNTIISPQFGDCEVLTVDRLNDLAILNHFKVVQGGIVQTHTWEHRIKHEEEDAELLSIVLTQLEIEENGNLQPVVLTNLRFEPEEHLRHLKVRIPTSGDRKKLVDLSMKNCRVLLEEKVWKQNFRKPEPDEQILEQLQKDLHLPGLPRHIECFDNSNLHGKHPVASLVVFRNAKASKKDYRHFKIRTVEGPDDFQSMAEIVHRRYSRLLAEGEPLPDLIVVDGGKGQLSHAAESLEKLGILRQVPIIGIAKKLEEIYVLNDPFPLHLDKRSTSLKVIQQLRNEAHRFAITFHRQLRSKAQTRTSLREIEGIGDTTAQKLLTHFKSVKKIREAGEDALAAVIGKQRAAQLVAAIAAGKLDS